MSTLSDHELSRLVAEKVAGWTQVEFYTPPFGYEQFSDGENQQPSFWRGRRPEAPQGCLSTITPYATSADAVLPLLEKWISANMGSCGVYRDVIHHSEWRVSLATFPNQKNVASCSAQTFARAASLALLKAAGVEV